MTWAHLLIARRGATVSRTRATTQVLCCQSDSSSLAAHKARGLRILVAEFRGIGRGGVAPYLPDPVVSRGGLMQIPVSDPGFDTESPR